MPTYNALGLMSGTSLDGVDIAYCSFEEKNGQWHFEILQAETVGYGSDWKKRLEEAPKLDALNFMRFDAEYGSYLGDLVSQFIAKHQIQPQLVASHGHTIFHEPDAKPVGLTTQIGHGAYLFAQCGIPVVCDFRTVDVALGGQGAPLVPIGDKLLFADYDYCLNLGGIANVSFEDSNGEMIAFDTSPCNLALNHLASQKGLEYDKGGVLAKAGKLNSSLLKTLDELPFYGLSAPKSLGREWMEEVFLPKVDAVEDSVENKLHTICVHIARQISAVLPRSGNLLATGGGALNVFLMDCLREELEKREVELKIPSKLVLEYKEALVFALLGLLRLQGRMNTFSSVTGAKSDNLGGALYGGGMS